MKQFLQIQLCFINTSDIVNEIPVSGRSSKRAGDFLNSLVIVLHQMKNSRILEKKIKLR
jgi:hypothetical protein